MKTRLIAVSLALLLLGAAPAGPPPEDQRAIRSFLVHVYTSYRECHGDVDRCAKPVPWPTVFTQETMRLITANERLNQGEVGVAGDGDPICQCQDFGNISVQAIDLVSRPDGRVGARVRFNNWGSQHVTLVMERTPAGWRVYDVIEPPDRPSYRQALIDENRSLVRAKHR